MKLTSHEVAFAVGVAFLLTTGCFGAIETVPHGDDLAGPGEFVTLFADDEFRKEAQEKLGLDADRVSKAATLANEFRADMKKRRLAGPLISKADDELRNEANKKIAALFDGAPLTELQGIGRLHKGADALLDEDVVKRLQISPRQREKLIKIKQDADKELRSEIDRLPRVTEAYVQKLYEKAGAKKDSQMSSVLTAAQKKQWDDLKRADRKDAKP